MDRMTIFLLLITKAVTGSSPVILPLSLTAVNSSRLSLELQRRHLSNSGDGPPSSTARMSLHDDLVTEGYYSTRLFIGTPPQEFALIVDSGSTVTYVPCSSCTRCGIHQDPRFQPEQSITYEQVKCNLDCNCDREKNYCVYERRYAERSSSSGVLGEDLLSFGKESSLKPQRVVFGCENDETGDLFSQHADGIMGLGRGRLSIIDQLVEKRAISNSFSLCYGGMDIGGGTMVLGEISPPIDMVFSNSDPSRSPYYNIELKEIHVAGKPLQLDPSVFDRKHGTVLDSGTTYTYLPEEAFKAVRDAITDNLKSLKQISGPDPSYKDTCFYVGGSDTSKLVETFPKVDLVFGNRQKLSLSLENYLFRHTKVLGAYCLGIFQNGRDATTLLGGIIVRNTLVTYDRQNERIGFWKTNCSELWKRLDIDTTPQMESASSNRSSTEGAAPALSPGVVENQLPPGLNRTSSLIQIGIITFDMSWKKPYADTVSHSMELADLIAHDLQIDTHQVKLMNVSNKGNSTLTRWAIFPAGSDYFSDAVAMDIITRLTEHRIHIPESFGSYQLLEWKVEPPSRRKSWPKHLWAIIIGIILFSLLAILLWYIWRRRPAGPGAYRPVDAVVPEQELQPM